MDRAEHTFDKWYGIFQSFQLEWEKRNTSEHFHLFRNVPVEWPEPFEPKIPVFVVKWYTAQETGVGDLSPNKLVS